MKSQMRFIDISGNTIVLRFLDNIIVTAGYNFSLEYFGIENNAKTYVPKNQSALCGSKQKYKDKESIGVSS